MVVVPRAFPDAAELDAGAAAALDVFAPAPVLGDAPPDEPPHAAAASASAASPAVAINLLRIVFIPSPE
jgi:hypothetical protein